MNARLDANSGEFGAKVGLPSMCAPMYSWQSSTWSCQSQSRPPACQQLVLSAVLHMSRRRHTISDQQSVPDI